jgi:polyhydroxybutyrate depolymerase
MLAAHVVDPTRSEGSVRTHNRWFVLCALPAALVSACSSTDESTGSRAGGSTTGGDTAAASGGSETSSGGNSAGGTAGSEAGDTGGVEPNTGGAEPTTGGAEPGTGGAEPTTGGADPGTGGAEPPTGGADPGTGGADPGTGGADPGTGGAPATEASPGCGQPAPAEPPATLDLEGTTRTFIVDVPPSYDPNLPLPILFAFHGMGTSGDLFRSQFYGNLPSAFGNDTLLVHPDALGDPTAWDNGGDDVLFFDAMLELLSSLYCVDMSRVFATGHSSGGFFTNTLGCQRGDVLRAIAPVSGGGPFVFGGNGCVGQLAVWLTHGSNDETVAFTSGEDSRDYWGEANQCDLTQSTPTPGDAPCVDYPGCDAGFPVRWCVHEDGHNWPSFIPQAMHDFFFAL